MGSTHPIIELDVPGILITGEVYKSDHTLICRRVRHHELSAIDIGIASKLINKYRPIHIAIEGSIQTS